MLLLSVLKRQNRLCIICGRHGANIVLGVRMLLLIFISDGGTITGPATSRNGAHFLMLGSESNLSGCVLYLNQILISRCLLGLLRLL